MQLRSDVCHPSERFDSGELRILQGDVAVIDFQTGLPYTDMAFYWWEIAGFGAQFLAL
jgi:hypothetical protein